jgi:hypothetical protein
MGQMKRTIAREEKERTRPMEQQRCAPADANTHLVLMNYMAYRNGWRVSFTESDRQTLLPKDHISLHRTRSGSCISDSALNA